ncbi:MAG: hypothetical protein ACTSQQ_11815, partial [Candidatus Helarchaeota archaeon]
MMINSNYFIEDSLFQTYIQKGYYFYLIMAVCVIVIGILIYIAERVIHINTYHLFIIYYGFLAAGFFIFKTIGLPFIGLFLILLVPIYILMGLLAYHLIWKTTGQMRQKMFFITLSYVIFTISIVMLIRFLLVSEYIEPFIATNYYIPLDIKTFLLIASTLAGWGFYSIPSFTEFDWKEKIQSLYILNHSGICIYNQDFKSVRPV